MATTNSYRVLRWNCLKIITPITSIIFFHKRWEKSNIKILFHSSIRNLESMSYHSYFDIYKLLENTSTQSCLQVTFLGPDPNRRNADPTRDSQHKVWPPYVLCFMNSTFELSTGNDIQSRTIFLFESCNVFRGWINGLLFFKIVSRQHKDCKYQNASEVHSRFKLSRSEQWSLNSSRIQGSSTSQSARPDQMKTSDPD